MAITFESTFTALPPASALEDNSQTAYMLPNESGREKTIDLFKNRRQCTGTVGVIVGPSFNFALDLIAAINEGSSSKKIDHLIVLDNHKTSKIFWSCFQDTLLRSNNIVEYMITLMQSVNELENKNVKSHFSKVIAEEINSLSNDTAWPTKKNGFDCIKKLFTERHFSYQQVDFLEEGSVDNVVKTLQLLNLKIDFVYMANIREVAENCGEMNSLQNNIKALRPVMTDETIIIDTQPRNRTCQNCQSPLMQRKIRKIITGDNIEEVYNYSQGFKRLPSVQEKTIEDIISKRRLILPLEGTDHLANNASIKNLKRQMHKDIKSISAIESETNLKYNVAVLCIWMMLAKV